MKTYQQLTEEQQKAAVDREYESLLKDVIEGLRFNDEVNRDNLQAAIDEALAKAEENQTPWFAPEYVHEARYFPGEGHIVEDDGLWPVSETLGSMAECTAEDAMYSEKGEYVVAEPIT